MTREEIEVIGLLFANLKKKVKYSDSSETVLKAATFNLALDEAARTVSDYAEGRVEKALITRLREIYGK